MTAPAQPTKGDPCPHGIPHEQRKRDGCEACDQASFDAFRLNQEAAKFRARVIQTARAVLPAVVAVLESSDPEGTTAAPYAFMVAEAFERAADEYEQNGGSK